MKKFEQIVIPEKNPRLTNYIDILQRYSHAEIALYDQNPEPENELIERVRPADCILIGSSSKLSGNTIRQCKKLKYIGLAATLFTGQGANIDVPTAAEQQIVVTGISDYGDIGVVEFVLSEIIQHVKYGEKNRELKSQKVGIIGAGATGSKVAKALKMLGVNVYYYSRQHKLDLEQNDIHYLSLHELLETVSIISIHVPRNTEVLGKKELTIFNNEKLILNTSVGLPIEAEAMREWLDNPRNSLIVDNDGIGDFDDGFETLRRNVKFYPRSSGFTEEAQRRLIEKVEKNIINYFKSL